MNRSGTALATYQRRPHRRTSMTRLALAAPIAILAVFLAGCASRGPATPAPVAVTPIEQSYRAGTGMQRLRIRMDDGRMQYVDTTSRDFAPGTRVLLSDANEIRRQ